METQISIFGACLAAVSAFGGPAAGDRERSSQTAARELPRYRNPVIYADCPDPAMCRYGDSIYMVSTTMHFVPGAPVMRSKDMVHWQTVSYIFDRFDFGPQYSLEDGKTAYGGGQWVTSLVHHDGKFYAWFIANGSGGFVYTADRPEGPWKLLTRAPHLHDGLLLFDDDARVYVFHGSGRVTELEKNLAFVKKGGLDRQLFELGEETALLEGSAAFKKDGYYYLMMVSAYLPDHPRREVCYRSRSLTGEWEKKVILETESESYGGVGQGCVVECPDGKWRALVFQDRGGIGRVPMLMDVTWKDGWPMLGDKDGKIPTDVTLPYPDISGIVANDDFESETIYLRIRTDFRAGLDWAELDWSLDGKSWKRIGPRVGLDFDWQRLFVGSRFAIFCYPGKGEGGHVDIDFFRVRQSTCAIEDFKFAM